MQRYDASMPNSGTSKIQSVLLEKSSYQHNMLKKIVHFLLSGKILVPLGLEP